MPYLGVNLIQNMPTLFKGFASELFIQISGAERNVVLLKSDYYPNMSVHD